MRVNYDISAKWILLKLHFEMTESYSLKLFKESIYCNIIIRFFLFGYFQSQGLLKKNLKNQWKKLTPKASASYHQII